jgi:hypothetical protein
MTEHAKILLKPFTIHYSPFTIHCFLPLLLPLLVAVSIAASIAVWQKNSGSDILPLEMKELHRRVAEDAETVSKSHGALLTIGACYFTILLAMCDD